MGLLTYRHTHRHSLLYSLGYDMNNAPNLSDLDWIIDHDIDADDYFSCAGLEVNK